MLLSSKPNRAAAPCRLQDRSIQQASCSALAARGLHTTTPHPIKRTSATTKAASELDAKPTVAAIGTSELETGLRLHPDALARRQAAQKRQEERNHIVSLRQNLRSEGKSWWETQDTQNSFTVCTEKDYKERLQSAKEQDRLAVCLLFAPWCMACRTLHPKLEQIAEQNPDVTFIKANVEHIQEFARTLKPESLPWFIFHKGSGEPVSKFTASLQPTRLAKLRAAIALHKA